MAVAVGVGVLVGGTGVAVGVFVGGMIVGVGMTVPAEVDGGMVAVLVGKRTMVGSGSGV